MVLTQTNNAIILFVFPIIIFFLALVLRKLEKNLAGSKYWKEKETHYWVYLMIWAIFYSLLLIDCNIKTSLPINVCMYFNSLFIVLISVIGLFAAFKWHQLAKKRTELLKKYKI